MDQKDLIAEVAKRLEWTEEKVSDIVEIIIEAVGTELKMNNPVVIDDMGTLKTDIQSEYILVKGEPKERYLMPPSIEVIFEPSSRGDDGNSAVVDFTIDEALYKEMNSSFSPFEPTLLGEGVSFPDIPEFVDEEESENDVLDAPATQVEIYEPEEPEEKESIEQVETAPVSEAIVSDLEENSTESPPHFHREPITRKRRSPVWIPIAGGIAIVVASLFFFKEDRSG